VRHVLDTNAVSALMRGDHRVMARLQRVPRASVVIPQPVFAEIAYGIARLPRSRRRQSLQERLDLIRSEIISAEWTDAVSQTFGDIKAELERKGERIEDFDAAIAAHAVATDATLVSANAHHMRRIRGLHIEDWAAE
jgi:tRNA(fMet)-specific endonuclease VapC